MLKRLKGLYNKFFSGYYNLLLWCIFLLFVFRPYDRGHIYEGIWKVLLTGVLLSSIFNAKHSKPVKILAIFLAIPVVIFSWINLYITVEWVFFLKASLTVAFMLVCTSSIVYDVLLRARVTLETLRGVICAYFLVAFAFAYVYYLIEFLHPGAMFIANKTLTIYNYIDFLSEMLYFSFITLLTIGYGDVVPVHDVAQTTAVIEGIIGQFYIAILVARLVSVYSFLSDKRMLHAIEKDIGKK
jgi:voltage-gated potassium channel